MLKALLCGLMVFLAGLSLAASSYAGDVQTAEEKLTLPWHTSEPIYKTQPDSNRALYPKPGSQKLEGNRDFPTIILQNQYIKVQAIPELGGVVARAIYKPTGDDFFYFEGRAKDWLPWWESGVKVSFPYYEHGLGTDQPAGYSIIEGPTGERTLAMWMEFSRFTEAYQRRRYGRFSNMMLTQLITVRPHEATFSITYRIVNPAPYKQGRRLWNDTLLPRNHPAAGVVQGDAQPPEKTATQWIFPAAWVSDHGGMNLRQYDESKTAISDYQKGAYSMFAWSTPSGFAGLWYPEVSISRLRLCDPRVSPGAKQYFVADGGFNPAKPNHAFNFCELWGGTDNVFEGIENWLGPGESFAMTFRYALVKGIGKTTWASDPLAFHADLGGEKPRIQVVTFKPAAKLRASWDDLLLGNSPCAPDAPAVFALPPGAKTGQLVLTMDGAIVFKKSLPLEIPADPGAHPAIKAALINNPLSDERHGNADEQGHTYQSAIKGYPDGSADRGRVLYRDGQLPKAIECLKAATATNADDGEAWHLLGASLLENGQRKESLEAFNRARDARTPYPAAGYFIALDELAQNERGRAAASVLRVLETLPSHWEARLLYVWLSYTSATSQPMDPRILQDALAQDPADPRLLWIVREREPYKTRFEQIMREPGAKARVEQFEAATRGQYIPPARIK